MWRGRDSRAVLENGYHLMATDISKEAIAYCKRTMPSFQEHFSVLDCLSNELDKLFDFIYGIAVIQEAPAGQVKWLFYCPHWLT